MAVLFAFPSPGFASFTGNACGATTDWLTAVRQLTGIWKRAGVHIFLVPAIPNPRTTDQARTIGVHSINFPNPLSDYQGLVRRDPRNVTLLDGGSFLRDATGSYQWRMPCESSPEVGCAADHTITFAIRMASTSAPTLRGKAKCVRPPTSVANVASLQSLRYSWSRPMRSAEAGSFAPTGLLIAERRARSGGLESD